MGDLDLGIVLAVGAVDRVLANGLSEKLADRATVATAVKAAVAEAEKEYNVAREGVAGEKPTDEAKKKLAAAQFKLDAAKVNLTAEVLKQNTTVVNTFDLVLLARVGKAAMQNLNADPSKPVTTPAMACGTRVAALAGSTGPLRASRNIAASSGGPSSRM